EATVAKTGIAPSARAFDIGTGNAAVAIRLAERFGLTVEAVEFDPAMADLARSRIAASAAREAITLHEARSDAVLSTEPAFDLIVALGVTEPIGEGVRDPRALFEGLARHLTPGGHLLWGDLVWLSEPTPPLRQIV
ncbi:SAM-dependent methyltransferase, partial [Acinetobacter baumannii]|uniref:SAM-dependent methyltransferase n=1 Tax=Acinetobacter baumannii TaxID=470 RepID=UPI00189A1156